MIFVGYVETRHVSGSVGGKNWENKEKYTKVVTVKVLLMQKLENACIGNIVEYHNITIYYSSIY